MVELGLRDVGYNYIVLDDCWSDGRYPNGTLKPDFTKFPNGMAHVADQIHQLGLLFGMYSSAGLYTCAQYGMHLRSLLVCILADSPAYHLSKPDLWDTRPRTPPHSPLGASII